MDETRDLRAVADDAVLVDAGPLGLLRGTGADRVAFLHRLLTGDVAGTAVGRGAEALLLTPKAQITSALVVLPRADDVRIVTPPGQADTAAAALSRYAIMDDFVVAPEPGLGLRALVGPRTVERLGAAGLSLPEEIGARFAELPVWWHADVDGGPLGALWMVRVRLCGGPGLWIWGDPGALAALEGRLASNGVRRLAPEAAAYARIEAREPRWGAEITGEHFPMEVGLGHAIDYRKGCFLGQEPIVRIRDRGHINWRLAALRFDGGEAPTPGDALESDARPKAGTITSAAALPGAPAVALALVHVSVPVGGAVRARRGESVLPAVVVGDA